MTLRLFTQQDTTLEATPLANGEWKTRKVFVGGLPYDVTDEQMKDYFSKFGTVEEVLLMNDRETGRPRGMSRIVAAIVDSGSRGALVLLLI